MFNFILKKSISSLKYLGVTSLIISLAVFFSAFSSMALITLANQFFNASVGDSRVNLGGDVSVYGVTDDQEEEFFSLLDSLKEEGVVQGYTSTRETYGTMLKKSGRAGIKMGQAIAVYDENYPLVGDIKLENGKRIKESIDDDSIVISKDLGEKLNIKAGDTISLLSFDLINSVNYKVETLVSSDTNNRGGLLFMSPKQIKDVSSYLSGKEISIIGDEGKISNAIEKFITENDLSLSFKTVSMYNEESAKSMKGLTSFFRGLSILGLFIGSLGIASSMQVLISRRKREIGIMKTIGFNKLQVIFSFILELVIISFPGILVGIIGGHFFSIYLIDIITMMGANVSFDLSFDFQTALLVFGVSLFSAIIFAFQSVERYASLMPVVVLRENSEENGKMSFIKSAVIFLIVGGLFTGLSIFITQDIQFGLIFVGVAAGGTLLASIIFRLLFWLILRIPVRTKNFIELSWLNLRKSYKKMMLSTVAIFVGVVSITLILCLIESSRKEMQGRLVEINSTANVITVYDEKNDSFTNTLKNESSIDWFVTTYQSKVEDYTFTGRDSVTNSKDILITEGELLNGYSVLAPSAFKGMYEIGSELSVNDRVYKITGFYEPQEGVSILSSYISNSFVMYKDKFFELVGDNYKEVDIISTSKENESVLDSKLSTMYPNSIVLTNTAMQDYYNSSINMLVKMIISVASLALLAGGILLLNTTSLEVITRRRSFGLLKVIGFDNRKVRWMLLLEYGFVFLITFGISYLFSYLAVVLFNNFSEMIFGYKFEIEFLYGQSALLMLGMASVISILIYLISKRYLDTKPVDVLRYE